MTTIDYDERFAAPPQSGGFSLAGAFRVWRTRARKRRERRLTLFELSRLNRHLLRDVGINPADVRAALAGDRSSVWLDPMRPLDHE